MISGLVDEAALLTVHITEGFVYESSWRAMVERGDWEVEGNGVAGEVEKWKEADEEGT